MPQYIWTGDSLRTEIASNSHMFTEDLARSLWSCSGAYCPQLPNTLQVRPVFSRPHSPCLFPCKGGGQAVAVVLDEWLRLRYSVSPNIVSSLPLCMQFSLSLGQLTMQSLGCIFCALTRFKVQWFPSKQSVECKGERMKKLNCLSIQEKKNTRLIYRERPYWAKLSITTESEADYKCQS